MRFPWTAPLSALLASAVLLGGLPGVAEAQDRPDLKVEDVKLFVKDGQVNDRVVSFKVTNVGKADATEATGEMEILSPPPAKEEGLKLGKIAKGASVQGFAQLPGPCDGHTVKVTLKAPNETSLGNNTVGPVKLCESKSPPKPPITQTGGVVTGPVGDVAQANPPKREADTKIDTDLILLPEHLRSGEHTLVFEPTAVSWSLRETRESGVLSPPSPEGPAVGWSQYESAINGPLGGDAVQVAQTAVAFDLAKFEEVPNPDDVRATLTFDEVAARWTDGDGGLRYVPGCVSVLGIATIDWANQPTQGLFPNATVANVTPNSSRAWDVTPFFQDNLARFGYVLRGSLEDGLEADDDSSCMSTVSNIRLRVTYVVPN